MDIKKVLVVSPHMDDEVLGVGGTIAKHVDRGDEVYVCIVAYRVYNRRYNEKINAEEQKATKRAKEVLGYKNVAFFNLPDERLDGCIQDILIPLEEYYNTVKPDILYTNFYGDNNQDHRAAFSAVRVVMRASAAYKVSKVLMYEVPSSTDQSPPIKEASFNPNFYVNIGNYWQKKVEAFRCYTREKKEMPHPRSEEALRALAVRRGVEAGFPLAEGFIILRDEWR